MFWAWISTLVIVAFAGAGVKWAVDRVWPPPPRVIEIPAGAPARASRLTVLDDTMDVLVSGYEAGKHARPDPELSVLERLGVPAGVALPGGGWASGACLDGLPAGRPADWPSEIEEWVLSRPGQP